MLTRPPTRSRPRRVHVALARTAMVAHPGLVALTAGLAAFPTLLGVVFGGDLFLPLVLAGVGAGASLGWSTDDPAAELLASMPFGAPLRSAWRAGSAALVAGAVFGLLLVAVAIGPGLPPDVGDRTPEATTAAATALALGLLGARRGDRAPGAAAVTGGMLGTAFVAALAVRFRELPTFLSGPSHPRWWLAALAALVVAFHAGRDSARRPLLRVSRAG